MDDDIIEINWNNSDISEISEIRALLFHLCNLYHYYFYSGVGHGALLQREHVISLLFAFIFHYSAGKHGTLWNTLWQAGIWWDNCHDSEIKLK